MKLRATREASGKTQAQAAKEARVAERLYQDYEYDKCEPGVRTAIRIARALNSTVEALFEAEAMDDAKQSDYLFQSTAPVGTDKKEVATVKTAEEANEYLAKGWKLLRVLEPKEFVLARSKREEGNPG